MDQNQKYFGIRLFPNPGIEFRKYFEITRFSHFISESVCHNVTVISKNESSNSALNYLVQCTHWMINEISLLHLSGLSYQLSSASTHSLPSRIDQLSDSENDYEQEEEEFDSSSALDTYDEGTPTKTRLPKSIGVHQQEIISGRKSSPKNQTIALIASW